VGAGSREKALEDFGLRNADFGFERIKECFIGLISSIGCIGFIH
jgi:hypothetical protein